MKFKNGAKMTAMSTSVSSKSSRSSSKSNNSMNQPSTRKKELEAASEAAAKNMTSRQSRQIQGDDFTSSSFPSSSLCCSRCDCDRCKGHSSSTTPSPRFSTSIKSSSFQPCSSSAFSTSSSHSSSWTTTSSSHRPSWTARTVTVVLLCVLLGTQVVESSRINSQRFGDRQNMIFHDTQQGDFVQKLASYEVVIPRKVRSSGEFVSHSVHHHIAEHHRNKRWAERKLVPSEEEHVHYQVNVAGQDLHLALKPNHMLFAPGLLIERRVASFGNMSDVRLNRVHGNKCHFVGEVREHARSTVAVSTCEGLHGLIQTSDEEYFIEPVKGHDLSESESSGHPHIIYKRSALPQHLDSHHGHERGHQGTCATQDKKDTVESVEKARKRWQKHHVKHANTDTTSSSDNHEHGGHHRRQKRSISLERNVEVLVVVDKAMMDFYEQEDIENYVLTIMNMVSNMYHDSTIGNAVNIILVKMLLLEEIQKDLTITHHADNTLSSFCKWQNTINTKDDKHPNHHDVAILLTRTNICARMNEPCSTLGLAQVSGLCQPHRSCNINEDTGLSLAYTVAHELGHNFGMQHDGTNNKCSANPENHIHIMAPQLNARPTPVFWSNCSREAITRFLDRDWGYCTNDDPSEHDYKFPVLPPGVMYDVDHQCRLQFGPEAKFCEGIDEPCSTLWCKVNKRCVTKLEASAPGTLCGDDKWCFMNKCEVIMEKPEAVDGEWGVWGEWTSCSRTCGAGVSYKERHCNNPPPAKGGNYCLGERKRYRICNTDDCPVDSKSFKAVQCSSFDEIPYKGKIYEWEPVATPATPCQLHCKPKDKFFSVMLQDAVADGTPCRAGRRDMCISGRPRHVGCDWEIDSDAQEDRCGICHGDGTSCKTVQDQFNKTVGLGYESAITIPAGARNIRVEEVAEANNYLAIRDDKGQFLLNGNWFIQWSGDYEAGGTVIHYRRDGNLESFKAPGPLKEPLQIMLLFQSENPGVTFEYTIPNGNLTDVRTPEYYWKYMDWTHCTLSCGGGTQRSQVVCVEKEAGLVEHTYCNSSTKPDDMQRTCNSHLCPARWWTGPWQHCSATCGNHGIHKRTVICIRSLGPDNQMALEDHDCDGEPKPNRIEPCHHKEPCPMPAEWRVGEWSDTCNGDPCATQIRRVLCSDEVHPQACDAATMPRSERKCSNFTCDTYHQLEGQGTMTEEMLGDEKQGSEAENIVSDVSEEAPKGMHATDTSSSEIINAKDNPELMHKKMKKLKEKAGSSVEKNVPVGKMEEEVTTTFSTVRLTSTPPQTTSTTTRVTRPRTPRPTSTVQSPTTTPAPSPTTILPSDSDAPEPSPYHKWIPLWWGQCSKPCNGGIKKRGLMCFNTETSEMDDESFCESQTKPATEEECNMDKCVEWTVHPWSECSSTCGPGSQTRQVSCEEEEEDQCDADNKPTQIQECHADTDCVDWVSGPWSQCSASCGGGEAVRRVDCVNTATEESTDGCSPDTRPPDTMDCATNDCPVNANALHAGNNFQCRSNALSYHVCKALKRMGRCSQKMVQFRCCRTCQVKRRPHSVNRATATLNKS